MLRFLTYLIFILSVAFSSAGIILSSRLRNKYQAETFSPLLYFEVFIYTFGFYGIWGQVVIRSFLSPLLSPQVLARLSDIAMLLGLPFLIFAWLMLIRFSMNLSGRKAGGWTVAWFLLFNFSVLVAMGYYVTGKNRINPSLVIRYYYIAMNLVYFFIASYNIHLPWKGRSLIHDYDRKIIAPTLFLIMIVQCVPLHFYTNQAWVAILFIFGFFLGNTFLPVWFTYGTLQPALASGR